MWSMNQHQEIRDGLLGIGTSEDIRSVVGSAMIGLSVNFSSNPRIFILEICRVAEESDDKNDNLRWNSKHSRQLRIMEAVRFVKGE